jgi:hypothetical protein
MFTNNSGYITNTVSGDFTVDTNTLKVDSTNNSIGIGTTSNLTGKINLPESDYGEGINWFSSGTEANRGGVGHYAYESRIYYGGSDNLTFVDGGPSGTERMRINSSGNVGIGTTSPTGKFAVSDGTVTLEMNPTGAGLGFIGTRTNHPIAFQVNASEEMRLEADGDLHVDGDVIAFSTTVSDVALKTDIQMIPNALDKIDEVRGVTFTRHNGQKSAGIIAQELEKVLPEAVRQKKLALHDGKEYKTVEYDAIHGLLINCIKELKEQIKDLKDGFTK